MDSLTQVILGAAVGEAVLGKKVGNRAMLWGAFGGFLPDLDITSSLVMDEISALAVHRGISHSFFFAILFPIVLGWLVHRLYASGLYKKKVYKITATLIGLGTIMVTANFLPYLVTDTFNFKLLLWTMGISGAILFLMNRIYFRVEQSEVNTTWKDWYWLFFWAIITHPILDCFTTYGTQVFLPFSDYRVAFNVVSVADPIYTVPFLLCLIVAACIRRGVRARTIFNWAGIGISSAYLLFCFNHKLQVNKIFEKSFAVNNIQYSRYMTSPMILNNMLWLGIAETDSAYYHGTYSFMDEKPEVNDYNVFEKNYHLIQRHENDPTLKTLKWFSNNYYTVLRRPDGDLQYNDTRFGIFGNKLTKHSDYVFKFILKEKKDGFEMSQSREGRDITSDSFKELWDRINGKKGSGL